VRPANKLSKRSAPPSLNGRWSETILAIMAWLTTHQSLLQYFASTEADYPQLYLALAKILEYV